jgi:hypothetical protein
MKIKYTLVAISILLNSLVFSQVTLESNLPALNRYVGFDNSSGIDLPLENNGLRTLFSFENWPGYNSIAAQNNANRIYFPTDPSETQADIFSLIQIGDGINSNFQRDWMHVGITYGAGGDLMYTGIIQDPANAGNQTGGDAVVVWGDNETVGTQGPDNLRFIFMSAINPNNPGAGDDQGLETMRISPQGNVGLGNF